jgi:hypothetical protein
MVHRQIKMKSKMKSWIRGHLLGQTLPVVLTICVSAIMVRADGGVVLWQQTSGSITVTAFATQSTLRLGPADISFLIENNEQSRPILDARVFVALENASGVTARGEATHDQARNKLLYCSVMNLVKSGPGRMKVIVIDGSERYDLDHEVEVSGRQSPLIEHWKLLTFPFMIAILFVFHQCLAWKKHAWPPG